jgi:hypothetical protein
VIKNQEDKTFQLGKSFINSYKGNGANSNVHKVLQLIFEFACAPNTPKNNDGSVTFSWKDLLIGETDAEKKSDWLRQYIRDVPSRWEKHKEALNQQAFEQGLLYFPSIDKEEKGGGAGNVTKYRIKLTPTTPDSAVNKSTLPKGFIGYTAESVSTKNPLIKYVDQLTMKGLKLYILISIMLIPMVIGALSVWFGFMLMIKQNAIGDALSVLLLPSVIIAGLYYVFSPLYYLIIKRIIIAPTSLSPFKNYSTQIEYSPNGETHMDGRPVRHFRIVTYTSECAICGGRIDIEQKGRGYNNRLIGTCTNSPREHVYTFDHQTKTGKIIHSEYIDLL